MTVKGTEKSKSANRRRRGGSPRGTQRHYSVVSVIAQLILGVTVLGVPWFVGGAHPRAQFWLAIGVFLSLAACLLNQLRRDPPAIPLPVAFAPAVLAIGLGMFQLTSLPAGLVRLFSPRSAELWRTPGTKTADPASSQASMAFELGVVGTVDDPKISLYPAATRGALVVLILAVSVFFLAVSLFCTGRQPLFLLTIVAVLGGGTALFCALGRSAGFGPFGTRPDAAGFLNLCLACVIGLSVWVFAGSRPRTGREVSNLILETDVVRANARLSWIAETVAPLAGRLTDFKVLQFITISSLIGIVAAIALSGSWAGWLAALASVGAFTFALFRRSRFRVWSGPVLVAVLTAFLLVLGYGAVRVVGEVTGKEQTGALATLQHWRDGAYAASNFWLVGSGLGTYRQVYPIYEQGPRLQMWEHAGNLYLEVLVETGIAGLLLLIVAFELVGRGCARLMRDSVESTSFACGTVGLLALVGQFIYGFFSSALYVPANVILFALICGLVAGRSSRSADKRVSRHEEHRTRLMRTIARLRPRSEMLAAICLVLLVAGAGWSAIESRAAASVQTAVDSANLTAAQRSDLAVVDARIARLTQQLHDRPDDAEAQRRLAQLWIRRYRLHSEKTVSGPLPAETPAQPLDASTSPLHLHGVVSQLSRSNQDAELKQHQDAELEQLRYSAAVQTNLVNAVRRLLLSRHGCPLLADVQLLLAELGPVVSPGANGAMLTQGVRRLAGADVDVLAECALVDLQAGRFDKAMETWRRCVALDPARSTGFLKLAGLRPELTSQADSLMPQSPTLLVAAAEELDGTQQFAELRGVLLSKAVERLDDSKLPKDEIHHLQGRILLLQNRRAEALEQYWLAVELKPEDTQRRFELATLLRSMGDVKRAKEQISECLRLSPDDSHYEKTLRELIRAEMAPEAPPK